MLYQSVNVMLVSVGISSSVKRWNTVKSSTANWWEKWKYWI